MLRKIIAVVLTVTMLMSMLHTNVLAKSDPLYVKEVKLGSKSDLESNGYIVFDEDLNSGTGKGAVYLGYKTTNDPALALTDIKALEEGKDYQIVDSDKLNAEFFAEDAMADATALMEIVKEFRSLYESGELRTKYAYEVMQMYSYDKDTRIGDFIINSATAATLSLIILNASDDMKFGLYCALYMGLCDDSRDTWQQRMVDSEGEELDYEEYSGVARSMLVAVKSFRVMMNQSLNAQYGENEQMDVTLLSAKEALESYSYGASNLFDYFMNNELTSETLLPLAAVLSDNEIEAMKFIGFANFCYMQNGEANEELVQEAHKDGEGVEGIDFWTDSISQNTGKIAVTSDAIRDMATNDENERSNRLEEAEIGLGAATVGAFITSMLLYSGSLMAQNSKALVEFSRYVKTFQIDEFTTFPQIAIKLSKIQRIAKAGGSYNIYFGTGVGVLPKNIVKFATSTKGASMTTKGLTTTRVTTASKILSGTAKATIVLTVVLCLVDLGLLLYDLATHEDVDHAEKPSRALSLEKMSNGEYGYINYNTVGYVNGGLGDTNNDEAKKWMLLLTTTDSRMGEPIKANTFKVSGSDTMYGYKPVAILGQIKAVDLNANAFTHKTTVRLFYKTADPDTLASIFTTPNLIVAGISLVIVIAAGATILILMKKKRKKVVDA